MINTDEGLYMRPEFQACSFNLVQPNYSQNCAYVAPQPPPMAFDENSCAQQTFQVAPSTSQYRARPHRRGPRTPVPAVLTEREKKLQDKRHRNRLAARRCRAKKDNQIAAYEHEKKILNEEIAKIAEETEASIKYLRQLQMQAANQAYGQVQVFHPFNNNNIQQLPLFK